MIKLKIITKEEYDSNVLQARLQELIGALPVPTNGINGLDGKDGVTTTVTREVLANKERLLSKEEFEEFKVMMLRMEQDVRQSLSQTSGYFTGGREENTHDLPWHILSSETKTIATREQAAIHGILKLEGSLILEGSSQLVIEN